MRVTTPAVTDPSMTGPDQPPAFEELYAAVVAPTGSR